MEARPFWMQNNVFNTLNSWFIITNTKNTPFIFADFIKHVNDDGHIRGDHLEVDGIIWQVGVFVHFYLLQLMEE